jgi:serine/threonine-protein phosphatase with EF-hand domain
VDRGVQGVEVVVLLLALFVAWPASVVMNRGNHEDYAICCVYGFQKVS